MPDPALPRSPQFDTIVVGLGAVGSATALQLARRGQRVLGLDRWDPPHAMGSTHGDTRITRCAIGEGEEYVPLVLRSHAIWRELEAETGDDLLTQCGALILAGRGRGAVVHGKDDFVGRTIAAAQRYAIPHEVLESAEITHRFPQFRLQGDEIAYYEPVGGYVRPERCVAAQLALARRLGATVRSHTQVIGMERDGGGVCVTTASGDRFRAGQAVLAAGAWSPNLAGPTMAPHMTIARQVLHWLTPADPAAFAPGRFPVFIWAHGPTAGDGFYGFPIPPGGEGVKVATEQCATTTDDADRLVRQVVPAEVDHMLRSHVSGRLPGLSAPALRTVVCPYTNTRDGDFLLARLPENDRVLLVSACSGHGFKHSAGLGERIAERIVGADQSDAFGPARLLAA